MEQEKLRVMPKSLAWAAGGKGRVFHEMGLSGQLRGKENEFRWTHVTSEELVSVSVIYDHNNAA